MGAVGIRRACTLGERLCERHSHSCAAEHAPLTRTPLRTSSDAHAYLLRESVQCVYLLYENVRRVWLLRESVQRV